MKGIRNGGMVPSVEEVAAAERRYAARRRVLADRIGERNVTRAAELLLEAEICEAWAEELESGSALAASEYDAVLGEIASVNAGRSAPRGGVSYLIEIDRDQDFRNQDAEALMPA